MSDLLNDTLGYTVALSVMMGSILIALVLGGFAARYIMDLLPDVLGGFLAMFVMFLAPITVAAFWIALAEDGDGDGV